MISFISIKFQFVTLSILLSIFLIKVNAQELEGIDISLKSKKVSKLLNQYIESTKQENKVDKKQRTSFAPKLSYSGAHQFFFLYRGDILDKVDLTQRKEHWTKQLEKNVQNKVDHIITQVIQDLVFELTGQKVGASHIEASFYGESKSSQIKDIIDSFKIEQHMFSVSLFNEHPKYQVIRPFYGDLNPDSFSKLLLKGLELKREIESSGISPLTEQLAYYVELYEDSSSDLEQITTFFRQQFLSQKDALLKARKLSKNACLLDIKNSRLLFCKYIFLMGYFEGNKSYQVPELEFEDEKRRIFHALDNIQAF